MRYKTLGDVVRRQDIFCWWPLPPRWLYVLCSFRKKILPLFTCQYFRPLPHRIWGDKETDYFFIKIDMKYDRMKIHAKHMGRCAYCGVEIALKDMQVDHIVPRANFREYNQNHNLWLEHVDCLGNLAPACRKCNHYKSTFDLETFRKQLSKQLERLQKNTNYRLAKMYWQVVEKPNPIVFYFETV